MKLKQLFFVFALCVSFTALAQYRYEFSVNAGGGITSLPFAPILGNSKINGGGTAGVGVHFFFSPCWGVGSGAGFAVYNGSTALQNYSQSSPQTDITGDGFTFTYTYSTYQEKTTAVMLTIPLMLQYQRIKKIAFYGALGGKVGVPLSAGYTVSGDLATSGYFPSTDVLYTHSPEKGFSSYPVSQNSTSLAVKTAFLLTAEAGVKFHFPNQWNLYTGLYADYGLNDIHTNAGEPPKSLVTYQPATPSVFAYQTITPSTQLRPFAIGVMVRVSIGLKGFGVDRTKAPNAKTYKNNADSKKYHNCHSF